MSGNGRRSISLLPPKKKKSAGGGKGCQWMSADPKLGNEDDEQDILEMSCDTEEDKETLKTLYELFHAEVGNIPLLTPSEEKELSRRIQEDDDSEAFQHFVLANLRLVIACAKKVKDRMGHQSILSFMDLVQEGILGLMIAVRRFDYRRNTRFSTYGIPWIYQRIKMAMVQHRHGFSVPGYAGTSVHTMSKEIQAFKEGRLESLPPDVDMERLKVLTRISGTTVPIDYPDDSAAGAFPLSPDRIYANVSEDPDPDKTFSVLIDQGHLFREEALEILSENLSAKEYDILCRRFGLAGYGCQTLIDIAEVYGKSSEHIRSVINRSMDNLKKNPELKKFCASWGIV